MFARTAEHYQRGRILVGEADVPMRLSRSFPSMVCFDISDSPRRSAAFFSSKIWTALRVIMSTMSFSLCRPRCGVISTKNRRSQAGPNWLTRGMVSTRRRAPRPYNVGLRGRIEEVSPCACF